MTRPLRELPAIVAGVATRVLEVDGDGPPILLLHGFTDSADTWGPLMRALVTHGRRVVAIDLPGCGRAEPLGRPALPCHDAFAAAFVRGYAEAEKPMLVGNSLGGLLALRAAADVNVPVGAVVAIGPAGLGYGWRLRYFAALLRVLDPVLSLFDWVPLPPRLVRRAAAAFHARRLAAGRATKEVSLLYADHIRGVRDLARLRGDLLAMSAESERDPIPMDRIHAPVLLIWGDKDQLADPTSARTFLDAVPTARLEIFDRCGHCPQLEEPQRVAELILAAAHAQPNSKVERYWPPHRSASAPTASSPRWSTASRSLDTAASKPSTTPARIGSRRTSPCIGCGTTLWNRGGSVRPSSWCRRSLRSPRCGTFLRTPARSRCCMRKAWTRG